MALIFKQAPKQGKPKKKYDWDSWYEQNKERLSKKRKERYQNDPEYRAAALERSRHQRVKEPLIEDGYNISFNEAAKDIEVSVWAMREWRRKNYFPEPKHRNGRLWFTQAQVHLLSKLQEFFLENGIRTSAANREKLESLTSMIYANWQEN